MTTAPIERLLKAAHDAELERLAHLSDTCLLVGDTCRLVHALQRERGASSIYLGSHGQRFVHQRRQRIEESVQAGELLNERLSQWALPEHAPSSAFRHAGPGLMRRTAAVWQGMNALPGLRTRIDTLDVTVDDTLRLYNRLISTLLSVVFEAADTADNPVIARALVSLFHFIQGKELAGQERACTAFGFTQGTFDADLQHTLTQLIDAQQRCLETFTEFATPAQQALWQQAGSPPMNEALEWLRQLAHHGTPLPAGLQDPGEQWYALATQRIDGMKRVEDQLVADLHQCCHEQLQSCRDTPFDASAHLNDLPEEPGSPLPSMDSDAATASLATSTMGFHLGCGLVGLVQAQNSRLAKLSDELEHTRRHLRERKLIERAKGLLMAHEALSEEAAYRLLRKTAMDQGKPLVAVARAVMDLMVDRPAP
ncbi:nitrate regulatory protein [Larsenimonas rhizosphaerae]|uniref:Nitrate- and nitrite sensing domain-containing protein n=1 Tax=Larsenimonas rhizosphaerae TaxID=2944682 RepID=A0AA41ZF15_9GAMM|nr:nitrate regulatory protein [Larsenimonas rhizosphaerae]MCX2524087.1 nitrate- and nitrite sensing domain-containing protein [Larsenimonas rhizosphaerae]